MGLGVPRSLVKAVNVVAGTRHPALGTVTKIRFLPGEIHATVTVTPVHLSVRGLAAAAYLGKLAKGRAISR